MIVRVKCWCLVVLLVQCAGVEMFSFNVLARVEFKPTSFRLNSYFGYSVLLRKGDPSMVIIGAPKDFNLFTSSVQNPGNIYFCNVPNDNETSVLCIPRSIDKSGNARERAYHHRKDNMWLGMSITGTDYNNGSVVMCAPRWINQYYEDFYLGNGLCYALTEPNAGYAVQQYSTLTPLIAREHQGFQRYSHTQASYLYAYGQAGLSAKISEDGSELLLGAPGVYSWTGSIVRYSIAKQFGSRLYYGVKNTPNPFYTNRLKESSYFGYSVDLGKFDKSRTIYVGGAPRGADYKGQVFLFEFPSRDSGSLNIYEVLEGELFGEYFGSSLLVVDINKDGLDDLLVGAPLYAEKHHYDQGRVHVFVNYGDRDIRRQDGFITGDLKLGARFGSAMSKVGDMNDDGYEDVAIGAPYEDDGAGAVYIYMGSAAGLNPNYAQKIQVAGTKGFGISISKGLDIDNNQRNDFAVGAYNSNKVLLFKSHPYIHIQTTMLSIPKEISIGATNFTVQICLGFQVGKISGLETSIIVNLKVDEEYSRGQLEDPTDSSFTIYGQVGNSYCKDVSVSIDAGILDYSRPINVSLDFGLQKNPLNDSVFCTNCPILDPKTVTKHTLQVPFASGCGDDNVCQPDLKLTVELSVRSPFVIGSVNSISVNISVMNDGEPAYLPKVTLTPPANTPILRVPPKCHLINNLLSCDFENPLKEASEGFVSIELDTSNLKNSDQRLTFNVSATSVGDEAQPKDNLQVVDVMLKSEASINIFGESLKETYYKNLDQDKSNVIFSHLYEVYNSGPSALQYFHAFFFVPVEFIEVGTNVGHSLVDVLEQNENSPFFCKALNGEFYKAPAEGKDVALVSLATATESLQNLDPSTGSVDGSDGSDVILEGDESVTETPYLNQTQLPTKSKLKSNIEDGFTAASLDDFDLPRDNLTSESKALQIHCSDRSRVKCLLIHCQITDGLLVSSTGTYVKLNMRLNTTNIDKLLDEFAEIIFTTSSAAKSVNGSMVYGNATSAMYAGPAAPGSTPAWIIIISVICGILLLGLIAYGLYKCDFFKRQKREELQLLKNRELGQGEMNEGIDSEAED